MKALVLEASTSAAKAMIYDTDKGIVSVHTEEYLPQYNDFVTQDADGICRQTFELGRKAAAGHKIDIVALGGTWHSVMLLDTNMDPATRAFLWSYRGAVGIEKRLRKDAAFTEHFYRTTGCTVNSIYPAFKLRKLKEDGWDLSKYRIAGLGGYLFFRLTGRLNESESMVSGTGLMDIERKQYSKEFLDFAGITENQLGRNISFRETSPLTEHAAALIGLKAGTPVMAAYPDGVLNQVGENALDEGIMTFSVGTSAAIRLSSSKPAFSDKYITWCYLSPSAYLIGAATSGACNCVDWIKEKLFDKAASYAQIESAPVDQKNLPVFMPFLYGERSPGWNGDRTASFHDVLPQHGNADLYFSVMEGVLFNVRQCYDELCRIGCVPKKIKLSGGIANSKVWTQMCCDIFERKMELSPQQQASLIGGAYLAEKLLCDGSKLISVVEGNGRTVYPDSVKAEMYRERFEKYKKWYKATCSF